MLDLQAYLTRALDREVISLAPLGGGDVADAFAVRVADGSLVFAKTHPTAPPGFFVTEATGLTWLGEAHAIPVPRVLHVSDDPPVLVLEWIAPGAAHATTEVRLGRALAALHATGAPAFGREDRRSTGSRGLPNEPCATWAEFYATNRLLPLAKLAADGGALGVSTLREIEAVAGRLERLGGPPEPAARLHGDLWAGNRLVDVDGTSWLIDPAAHGGHREFDLAMMRLFGGFGEACFAAYAEIQPLAVGWEARIPLHQLAPLIVHAIKFGGGYAGATERALAALR